MKTILAALLLSSGLAVVVAPAIAGPVGPASSEQDGDRRGDHRRWHHDAATERSQDILSERRIARIVRRGGFAAIEEIDLRRDRYIVTAVRPNGSVYRLALDSRDGDIIGSERIGWSQGYDRRDYDRFRTGRHHRSSGHDLSLGLGG